MKAMTPELLQKYDVPAPRYTSYPTVPHWNASPLDQNFWESAVKETFRATNHAEGISIYLHLPFCEHLCTYCGCNTRITVNHAVEKVYSKAVLKEWGRYLDIFEEKPNIREIHLGGGTPTFFSPQNLGDLVSGILDGAHLAAVHEFSFEAHPGNTTRQHLEVLYSLGFRRISIGVQDFDPAVLDIINRRQTRDDVENLLLSARSIGYNSVNFDLVYGLPMQQAGGFMKTVSEVADLKPDRIALYSYAHVPWIKPGQRKFSMEDLPSPQQKLELYRGACRCLLAAGYVSIGMDHFALSGDELSIAAQNGTLHRNFMGYSINRTRLLIGLGASAISDAGTGYVQNEKSVEGYYKQLDQAVFPYFKGHAMTRTDMVLRHHILNIMCRLKTTWYHPDDQVAEVYEALGRLEELERDGLVVLAPFELQVTPLGQGFLRNICMAFDQRLWASKSASPQFSQAV